jgi:hypothetical protein
MPDMRAFAIHSSASAAGAFGFGAVAVLSSGSRQGVVYSTLLLCRSTLQEPPDGAKACLVRACTWMLRGCVAI